MHGGAKLFSRNSYESEWIFLPLWIKKADGSGQFYYESPILVTSDWNSKEKLNIFHSLSNSIENWVCTSKVWTNDWI